MWKWNKIKEKKEGLVARHLNIWCGIIEMDQTEVNPWQKQKQKRKYIRGTRHKVGVTGWRRVKYKKQTLRYDFSEYDAWQTNKIYERNGRHSAIRLILDKLEERIAKKKIERNRIEKKKLN